MRTACQTACALLLLLSACDSLGGGADPDQDRGHIIALGSQVIDTRLATDATTSTTADGYQLVKFPGPVTAEQIQELSAHARIYTYLPHDTFLVRPQHGGAAAMAALGATTALGASWTGAYLPAYKISTGAADLAAQAPIDPRLPKELGVPEPSPGEAPRPSSDRRRRR